MAFVKENNILEKGESTRYTAPEGADATRQAERDLYNQGLVADFLDTYIAPAYESASLAHNFTDENYRLPDNYNDQQMADEGRATLSFNEDGTYTRTMVAQSDVTISQERADLYYGGVTEWSAGDDVVSYHKTPELYKAESLGIPVDEYVKMVSYAEAYNSTDEALATFLAENPNVTNLEASVKAARDVYILSDGQTQIGYTQDSSVTDKINSSLEETIQFFSENSADVVAYQEHVAGLHFGDIAVATIEGIEEYGKKLAEVGFTVLVTGELTALAEGGMLLAASEGYIAADTAHTINELYTAYQTAEEIANIYEGLESGDVTALLESDYIGTGSDVLGLDTDISSTVTTVLDGYSDVQAVASGDISDVLDFSDKYGLTPEIGTQFTSEEMAGFGFDATTFYDDFGLDSDFDLSGVAFELESFDAGSFDFSLVDAYEGTDIDFSGLSLEMPVTGFDFTKDEVRERPTEEQIAEESATKRAQEEQDRSELEGEIELTGRRRGLTGRPADEEETGFKQTDIFQEKTKGTAELGFEAPTVAVDPLALDLPSFVSPYDPTQEYDPLRSV